MTIAEQIVEHVKVLPNTTQSVVLDFIEHLESKTKIKQKSENEWSAFSLSHAMRGMESENTPYSTDDLKESFI